jgi:chromosome segregation protein
MQAAVHRARAGARAAAESSRAARNTGLRELPGTALLSDLIELKPGHRRALEALVGPIDGVVVVSDRESAERVLSAHSPDDAITVMVAGKPSGPVAGAKPLLSDVKILGPGAEEALADVYVASSLSEALRLAGRHRHAVFVTADGAVAGGGFVSRGSAEIADAVARCEREIAIAKKAMVELEGRVADGRRRLDGARTAARAHEVALARAAEAQRAQERQVQTLATEIAHLEETLHAGESGLQALIERSESITSQIGSARSAAALNEAEVVRVRAEHSALLTAYEEASRRVEETRVRWGIAQERKRQLSERVEKVHGSLSSVRAKLASLGERQAASAAAQELASSVAAISGLLAEKTAAWPAEAELSYQLSLSAVNEIDQKIAELQQARHNSAKELEELRILARQEDLGRSELKVRRKILEAKLVDELHVDPGQMLERLVVQIELPDGAAPADPLERLAALPDEALRRRQIRLERDLEQMGNVNPLAAREAEALAEREEFLATQMGDVRASRKDLRQIVESVDEKIRLLFSQAFEDVAEEYERLFKLLFPTGSGKLKLTDPTEILETGVEVEASPSGRSLKRLSLLSGGERALSALALLFAIFKARPSPFYILDEVEAALDDVNLQRFLGLLDGFRGTSQLLVVSHQKRTMEVADVLYGVAIRPDGVSKVISERLGDLFPDAPVGLERGLSRNEQ